MYNSLFYYAYSLNNEMFKFYRDDKNNKEMILENVEADMKCAAYVDNEKRWYRAKVESVDGDSTATVSL